MTRRTRRFLVFGVAILVVGLGTGLVASYVGLQNLVIIGGNGPAELAYVPVDATSVAFADVRGVMDSGVRQKLLKFSPDADFGADHFQQETGINVQTDVDRIVAAVAGSTDDGKPRPLLLVRGTFDKARIEAAIVGKGGTVADYNGQRLISFENELGIAFVEPDLAAIGEPNAVRRAIDTKAAGKNATSNAELMRLVKDSESGNTWAVARFDALTAGVLPPEITQHLPPVTWLAFTGQIDDGVRVAVRAETRDEKAANDLRDVIRGFVALGRMQAGQHAELVDLLNSIELAGQGTTVSLGFSIPPSVIDMLGAMRAQRPQPESAPGAAAPRRPLPPSL